MTDIKYNQPMTDADIEGLEEACIDPIDQDGYGFLNRKRFARAIEAAAFARGVAAMQGEIERLEKELKDASVAAITEATHVDELRAKLQALEEQKPVAYLQPAMADSLIVSGQYETCGPNDYAAIPVYSAAGAKQ